MKCTTRISAHHRRNGTGFSNLSADVLVFPNPHIGSKEDYGWWEEETIMLNLVAPICLK